jgi:transposase
MLVRFCLGEKKVWSTVRVPTEAQEAARQVSRERTTLTQEQTRLINQMRGWLTTQGTTLPTHRRDGWWTTVRDWAGQLLPSELQARLARASNRLALVAEQIAALDAQQVAAVRAAAPESPAARLVQLQGVAETSVSILLDEGLVWRAFRNRKELGGLLGFTPTPYDSGDSRREQGITGAGNARLQSVAIQLAWNWVRWQKQTALTPWYAARFGTGKRARRIGIVALARKLMIALWRCATVGVVPAGAILKPVIA